MPSLPVIFEDAAFAADIIRGVAEEEILPRWRNLGPSDVREKGPGDIVTEADERTERALGAALTGRFPGTLALGEEAVSKDPAALNVLNGPDPVWVFDPIDGTSAFAAGNARFTTIVTLMNAGAPIAAWVYEPVTGRMAQAVAGAGVTLDGAAVRLSAMRALADARVASIRRLLNPPRTRESRDHIVFRVGAMTASIGIGMDYLYLLNGDVDAVVFSTRNVWEQPAGVLLVNEAGGALIDATGQDLPGHAPDAERPFVAAGGRGLAQDVLGAVMGRSPATA